MRFFKESLYIVDRRVQTSLFYEDQPYIAYSFSNFVHPPPTTSLSPQLLPPLFFMLSCFFGRVGDHATFDVLFYLMTHFKSWYLSVRRPWYAFYARRHQVYWGLTHDVGFYWYSDLMSPTHKHTALSVASRLILMHPHNYIFAPFVLCSRQLPLLN